MAKQLTKNETEHRIQRAVDTIFEGLEDIQLLPLGYSNGNKYIFSLITIPRPYDASGCNNPSLNITEYRKFNRKIDALCDLLVERLGIEEKVISIKEYTKSQQDYGDPYNVHSVIIRFESKPYLQ